ncbi:class I SAM-dependent methyltransferase [Phaeobacter porticola]|uniref:C-methyltransferase domain-containing protein n=1 Tax=Phaeobacter porticola TaxID=1844006 RepID=A0A1L3I1X2_9RHOB|nr:class I SAM-dependent methyltransferase [Phaeobacter porticola]APG46141.1 hypothetical protein PhaeoP97_00703 [Phaeobacter porticola]
MTALHLPTTPNNPLLNPQDDQSTGAMQLRRNHVLNFVENARFDPDATYYDTSYENSQAHSSQFLSHMKQVLGALTQRYPAGSTLVEVGCGKGDFLTLAHQAGHFTCQGYDTTYTGDAAYIEQRYLGSNDRVPADIVVLRHVLEHIPQPHRFLAMLHQVFGDTDIYIEVPNLDWILQNNTFFDITYEHVNYFSQQALAALFGGKVHDAQLCFGAQYQYIIANLGDLANGFDTAYTGDNWQDIGFDDLFPALERQIDQLEALTGPKGHCFFWGAATKGCMFLWHANRLGRLVGNVPYAVDINPSKQGRWLPGSIKPIHGPDKFYSDARPGDILAISNPAYRDEIVAQLVSRNLDFVEVRCL